MPLGSCRKVATATEVLSPIRKVPQCAGQISVWAGCFLRGLTIKTPCRPFQFGLHLKERKWISRASHPHASPSLAAVGTHPSRGQRDHPRAKPAIRLCPRGLGSPLRRFTYKDPVAAKPLIASGKASTWTSLPRSQAVLAGRDAVSRRCEPLAQRPWETCFCCGRWAVGGGTPPRARGRQAGRPAWAPPSPGRTPAELAWPACLASPRIPAWPGLCQGSQEPEELEA